MRIMATSIRMATLMHTVTAITTPTRVEPARMGDIASMHALMQLMWLASPALPVGGFSYSEGLEAAIDPATVQRRPWLEMRLVTALHTRAHFLTPAEILALPRPDKRLRRLAIAWHGGRAEALAMSGNPDGAEGELKALRAARDALASQQGNASAGRRTGGTLEFAAIADAVARGRIASARGNLAGAHTVNGDRRAGSLADLCSDFVIERQGESEGVKTGTQVRRRCGNLDLNTATDQSRVAHACSLTRPRTLAISAMSTGTTSGEAVEPSGFCSAHVGSFRP